MLIVRYGSITYGKPCMMNLPPELGRSIIDQILNSKRVSDEERAAITKAEIERMEEAGRKLREQKDKQ